MLEGISKLYEDVLHQKICKYRQLLFAYKEIKRLMKSLHEIKPIIYVRFRIITH